MLISTFTCGYYVILLSGVGLYAYTVYRGLYGNGELGSHGNVLRHTVSSERLQDALLHLRNVRGWCVA